MLLSSLVKASSRHQSAPHESRRGGTSRDSASRTPHPKTGWHVFQVVSQDISDSIEQVLPLYPSSSTKFTCSTCNLLQPWNPPIPFTSPRWPPSCVVKQNTVSSGEFELSLCTFASNLYSILLYRSAYSLSFAINWTFFDTVHNACKQSIHSICNHE